MAVPRAQGWNMRHLDSLLSRTLQRKGLAIPGVSTPYLYFGMWRSIFAWCAPIAQCDHSRATVAPLTCYAPPSVCGRV